MRKSIQSLSVFSLLIASGGLQQAFGGVVGLEILSSTVTGSTAEYEDYEYTFDVSTPVNVRIMTGHITQLAYESAVSTVMNAVAGLSFAHDSNAPQTFNHSLGYANTVIFVEIDTNENFYTAAAVGFNNALQACAEITNIDFDTAGEYLTGISFANSNGVTDVCDDQIINTGLIIFNTNDWNIIFNPGGLRYPANFGASAQYDSATNLWLPPLAEQTHWVVHEFTHLLGLGHIEAVPIQGNTAPFRSITCPSMMTETLFEHCEAEPAPTIYTTDDLNVLDQKY